MRLTIIVPAHNEEVRIGRMLDAYLPYFSSRYGHDVEIIVVINGTTDRTEEIVAGYVARFPMLRACVEPHRVGKGGALMLGFKAARGDCVGFVDADGATPPEAFDDLVEHIGDAGAMIASRWCRGAQVSPRQPLARRVASRVFNLLTRVFFGLPLTDTQCGAKLMRADALRQVMPRLGITRWAFDVDLLFQLRRAGYRVREVPTVWHDVAGSKLAVGRASFEMLLALVRLRLLYSPFRWLVSVYDRTLGRWLNPALMGGDPLVMHSLIMLGGAQIGAVFTLAFQLVMVRLLSGTEYGVMAAMMGIVMTLGIPIGALGTTVMHYTARYVGEGCRGKVKALVRRLAIDLLAPSAALLAGMWLWGDRLQSFFNVTSSTPLMLTGLALVLGFYGAVAVNVLMGLQAFGCVSTVGNLWAVVRLAMGVALVMLGFGAAGALTSHVVGLAVGTAATLAVCWRLLGPGVESAGREPGTYTYFLRSLVALAAYGVLSNADVILAKRYFDADAAGAFAKAAMVARVVFFLPQPVALVLFPKVVSTGDASHASGRMLLKAVGMVALITVAAALFCTLFPAWVLRIIAGVTDPALVPVTVGMVWALAPLGVIVVLLNYELAQRRFRVTLPLAFCAAGYVLAVDRWHLRGIDIPLALGCASSLALALTLACLPWREMRMPEGSGLVGGGR